MASRRHAGDPSPYQRASDRRWVYALPAGYHGGKRRRRTVTARTLRELRPKMTQLRKEVAAGVDPEQWTIEKWLRHWHQRIIRREVAPRTWEVYGGYIENWLIPRLGRKRLGDLRPPDVRDLLDHMEDRGKSPRTRQQAYAVLHKAMQDAMNDQMVYENAVSRVKRPRAGSTHHPALRVSEGRRLLEVAPSSAERARWLCALLLGLRQGEALGLRWEDVHLDDAAPWVLIHQTAQRQKGVGVVIKATTKSNVARHIPLSGPLAVVGEALRQYRHELGGVGFVWRGDRPVPPERDWRTWRDGLSAAGLPMVSLHGARATAEAWLEESGVPRRTISDVLGHAQTSTTDAHYHRVTIEGITAGLANGRRALE